MMDMGILNILVVLGMGFSGFGSLAQEGEDTRITRIERIERITDGGGDDLSSDSATGAELSELSGGSGLSENSASSGERIRAWEWAVPVGLVAVGSAGTLGHWFEPVNMGIRDGMARLRGGRYLRFDDFLVPLPGVAYFSLGALGVRCKHDFKERLAVGVTAYACSGALALGGKYCCGVMRPDNSSRTSFPSGHSALVFTGAELMREEYGWGPGLASYGVAAVVGFLRMYNERHWLTDVLAGAGIGILSARVGYWMLPVYRRWFGWDGGSSGRAFAAAPGYDPLTRSVSVSLAMIF